MRRESIVSPKTPPARPAGKSVVGKSAMERRLSRAGMLPPAAMAAPASPTTVPSSPSSVRVRGASSTGGNAAAAAASGGGDKKGAAASTAPKNNSATVDAAAAAIQAAVAQRNEEEDQQLEETSTRPTPPPSDRLTAAGSAGSFPAQKDDKNSDLLVAPPSASFGAASSSASFTNSSSPSAAVTAVGVAGKLKKGASTRAAAAGGNGGGGSSRPTPQQQQQQIVLRGRFRGQTQLIRHADSNSVGGGADSGSGDLHPEASFSALTNQRTVETAFNLISHSPLFASLRDQRIITKIAETVSWASAEPGSHIVVAGDDATEMYFLFSGVVEVLVPVSEEEEMFVATLNGGDFFGEIALVSKEQTKRTASIVAAQPCELLVLSRRGLEGFIAESDELRECLELEAAKRLSGLKEREAKLLAKETDLDREMLRKAGLNPLSPIECEWRLLNKARIRGVHRTEAPPSTFPDVMAWARLHMQHTPVHFHGRTTAALATLPSDILDSVAESSSTDDGASLMLIHPEMGCVYKYSVVIDSLAGPDEFSSLCRSFARCLDETLVHSLQKQALGALVLAAHVTLFFSHTRRAERDKFLTLFADRLVATIAAEQEEAKKSQNQNQSLRRSRHSRGQSVASERGENVQFGLSPTTITTTASGLKSPSSSSSMNSPSSTAAGAAAAGTPAPPFVWDSLLLDSMTAGLYRAPAWEVSTQILFDLYPKHFVLSDAWAIATLERLVVLREELVKRCCATAIEQMVERREIVKQFAADRAEMEKGFVQRRLVIKKAMQMLTQVEQQHREKLERVCEQVGAGIFRWHEMCMSSVSSQRNAQEAALAGLLGSDMQILDGGGASSSSSSAAVAAANRKKQLSLYCRPAKKRSHSAGVSSHAPGAFGGLIGGGSSGRSSGMVNGVDVARLVAQKERMADDAVMFKQRVKELRRLAGQ